MPKLEVGANELGLITPPNWKEIVEFAARPEGKQLIKLKELVLTACAKHELSMFVDSFKKLPMNADVDCTVISVGSTNRICPLAGIALTVIMLKVYTDDVPMTTGLVKVRLTFAFGMIAGVGV